MFKTLPTRIIKMLIDVTVGNGFDSAINDIMDMLGLAGIPPINIMNKESIGLTEINILYRCVLGLCLGVHFTEDRRFIDPMMCNISIIDDGSIEGYADIKHAFDVFIYLHLESLRYNRICKITLDNQQDPQELFLALVYIIAEDNWFKRIDSSSKEYKELRRCILECASNIGEPNNGDIINNENLPLSVSKNEIFTTKSSDIFNSLKTQSTNKSCFDVFKSICSNKSNFSTYKSFSTMKSNITITSTDLGAKNTLVSPNELLEKNITTIASDITKRMYVLTKRKTVSSFDSELMRLIAGRSEYDKQFLTLMDDITQYLLPECSNERVGTSIVTDSTHSNTCVVSNDYDVELAKEITRLSNIIIQMQFRLIHLGAAIERDDVERLKHFARLTDQWKEYEKYSNEDNASNHRYKRPTPVELLLISNDALFKRHMALLKMMKKSLENEIRRKALWELSFNLLNKMEPKAIKNNGIKSVQDKRIFKLISKPSDIKYNVHVIKSFLVEGIPTANFKISDQESKSSTFKHVLDFLRQVNSNFANYRAATVADSTGRKITFYKFIFNEIIAAEEKGIMDPNNYESTSNVLMDHLHMTDDAIKYNPRMAMTKLKDWLSINFDLSNVLADKRDFIDEEYQQCEDENALEHEDFKVIHDMVNKVKRNDAALKKEKNNDLYNIVDFSYYFQLYKDEHERNTTKIVVDGSKYLKFTNLVDGKVKKVMESTINKQKISMSELQEICDEITKNTRVVFT